MSLKDKSPDKVLDVKGEICPFPLMKTRDALKEMKDGEILAVITDHIPAAKESIPRICDKKGYAYEITNGDGKVFKVIIEKRDS